MHGTCAEYTQDTEYSYASLSGLQDAHACLPINMQAGNKMSLAWQEIDAPPPRSVRLSRCLRITALQACSLALASCHLLLLRPLPCPLSLSRHIASLSLSSLVLSRCDSSIPLSLTLLTKDHVCRERIICGTYNAVIAEFFIACQEYHGIYRIDAGCVPLVIRRAEGGRPVEREAETTDTENRRPKTEPISEYVERQVDAGKGRGAGKEAERHGECLRWADGKGACRRASSRDEPGQNAWKWPLPGGQGGWGVK